MIATLLFLQALPSTMVSVAQVMAGMEIAPADMDKVYSRNEILPLDPVVPPSKDTDGGWKGTNSSSLFVSV